MFPPNTSFTVDSPAKINLTLEILGRRADGYHLLRSIVVPVSLFDTITVTAAAPGSGISCATEFEGVGGADVADLAPGGNLAEKAAAQLAADAGISADVRIKVVKRIPIGAGMGGGSADAAGTLTALNSLWNLGFSREKLAATGAKIGCDIPALVTGGAVLMEGVGEKITPLTECGTGTEHPHRGFWLVAAFPGFPVSTGKIYKSFDESCLTNPPGIYDTVSSSVRGGNVQKACCGLYNGLQKTVFGLYPDAEGCLEALRVAGALSCLLSGSGSAVFGLAESREHAELIRSRLSPEIWSRVLQTLPDGVMVAHGPLVP